MVSEIHFPSHPLNLFIESFYYFTDYEPVHSIDRFLPDGNVQIIFELTENSQSIYHNNSLKEIQSCRKVWFSGFRTQPITIPSGKESELVIVNIRKGRAYPFLKLPVAELKNQVVDAELVIKNILECREKMLEQPTPLLKLTILENFMLNNFISNFNEFPVIDFMIYKINEIPYQLKFKDIIEKTGYSQKHIIKLFKDKVGITPKEYLKVIRFQQIIADIEKTEFVDWNDLAFKSGFYDQSHFISDFKNFSGFTPTEYLRQKGETLNYIPIDIVR